MAINPHLFLVVPYLQLNSFPIKLMHCTGSKTLFTLSKNPTRRSLYIARVAACLANLQLPRMTKSSKHTKNFTRKWYTAFELPH